MAVDSIQVMIHRIIIQKWIIINVFQYLDTDTKDTSIKTLTKKMKEVGERDAGIIHSLNKDLSEKKKVVDEKDDAIKALESRLAEMEVNLMEKDEVIKTLMRQLEEKDIVTI